MVLHSESSSHDLLSQMPPIGRPDIPTGAGEGGEGYDLVDLAPRDFHFHGGGQEIGRIHDQLQWIPGGGNRPHEGQLQTSFISWDRHGVGPAFGEMLYSHT